MTRRQYLILFALAIPLVTIMDLPAALRTLFGRSTPATSSSRQWIHAATVPTTQRVVMLTGEPLNEDKDQRRSDSFPDVELTDQNGHRHFFRRDLVRDKIVCVLFFYSQCTGTCPGTIQMVSHLRRVVKDQYDARELQFIAITLDPEHDTPEVLKAYAEDRGISSDDGMAEWLFCTGHMDDLERVRRSLGLYDRDPVVDADRSQHAALVVFGNDRADRWTAQPSGLGSNDLVETFLRMTGTSERQRFAHRIGRSDEFMRVSAARSASSADDNDVLSYGHESWCLNPSECCSLPVAKP